MQMLRGGKDIREAGRGAVLEFAPWAALKCTVVRCMLNSKSRNLRVLTRQG